MPPRDLPNSRTRLALSVSALVLAALVFVAWPLIDAPARRGAAPDRPATDAQFVTHPEIGFRSRAELDEHFQKHGLEFGDVDKGEYLQLAQELRDRPLRDGVLELRRDDGVVTRFDEACGAFIAFNESLVIRTFFRPDDGVRYFRRQATKEHE